MSEEREGWRECADPVELAAAVADGVEVQRNWGYGWQPGTNNETAEQFAGCTKANLAYRVPASWSWSPEPPADVPTGAERYLAERLADPEYRAAYEAAAPVTGDDEWCGAVLNDINSIIHQHCESDGSDDAHCDWVNDLANEVVRYFQRPDVLPQPAPSPVPPWPGAVLSGLCAERAKSATPEPPFEGAVPTGRVVDGEPTYYAVAGEVPADGWRARGGLKGSWARPSLLGSRIIVEARRVPAPATERVELWDAVGRSLPDGREIVGWQWSTEARDGSVTHDDGTFTPVHDAPTVEVLKDGDR